MPEQQFVPEDPRKPGRDVLGVGLVRRGHFIHEVMASSEVALTALEIGQRAEALARKQRAKFNQRTFAEDVTVNHLRSLRQKGFAAQQPDRRWQLTEEARQKINASVESLNVPPLTHKFSRPVSAHVQVVDENGRILVPQEFANATVTIERVSETEIRVRKAVVIPEDELPLIEDSLKPLSDRDRDFFLQLLDNPPEPNEALKNALALHQERHG